MGKYDSHVEGPHNPPNKKYISGWNRIYGTAHKNKVIILETAEEAIERAKKEIDKKRKKKNG